MNKNVSYQWNLRKVMATRDMFATTDLVPLLAERGIHLAARRGGMSVSDGVLGTRWSGTGLGRGRL